MSEDKPHVVLEQHCVLGMIEVFPDYKSAYVNWQARHTWQRPFRIVTLGRECTPAAAIVDVNE